VVSQALAQGHEVIALSRNAQQITRKHPQRVVIDGHPTSLGDVERCVQGADAVIHCLGVGGKGDGGPTTLISDSVHAVLSVMAQHDVRRLVCMSNVGAGGSGTWLGNRLVIPIFFRWLLPILEDKDRMEAALRASTVEWVSVRLPMIVEGALKPVRVSTDGRGIGLSITAPSAAQFLLKQLTSNDHLCSTPSISN
jgi:putative NADH-flavin reductase